jgi:hypothetical protein
MYFYTNNSIKQTILSNGNIGIGTSSPSAKLSILGSAQGDEVLRLSTAVDTRGLKVTTFAVGSQGNAGINFDAFHTTDAALRFSTKGTEALYIDGSQNIGIGTSTPIAKLEVSGDFTTGRSVIIEATNASKSNGAYTLEVDSSAHTSNMTNAGALKVDVNSGTALLVNGNGDIGIGTSTPSEKLDIEGGAVRIGGNAPTGSVASFLYLDAPASKDSVLNFHQAGSQVGKLGYDASLGGIAFVSGTGSFATADMVILDSGAVGIGTSSPSSKLSISDDTEPILTFERADNIVVLDDVVGQIDFKSTDLGDSNVNASIKAKKDSGTTGNVPMSVTFETGELGTISERMRITSDGAVGIGTTSPSRPLSVQGVIGVNKTDGVEMLTLTPTATGGVLTLRDSSENPDIVLDARPNNNSYINNGGSFGIGTSSPSAKLEVVDDGDCHVYFAAGSNASDDVIFRFMRGGNSKWGFLTHADSGLRLYDYVGGGDHTYFAAGGNVGIGTISTSAKLHIVGSGNTSGTTALLVENSSGDDLLKVGDGGVISSTSDNPYLVLKGDNSAFTNAAIQLISENASEQRGMGMFMYNAHSDFEWYSGTPYQSSDNFMIGRKSSLTAPSSESSPRGITAQLANSYLTITSAGAVGIGTSTPSATLHLSQTGNADILIERAAGAELRLRSQSNLGYIGTDSNHPLNLGTNAATRLGIKTNGQLQFNTYTGTTHDGTPVKILGVDASGNVVKTTRTYQTKSSLSFDSLGEATVTLPSTALYGVTATLESSAAEFIVIAQYLAGTSVKFKLYDHTGSAVASVTRTVHYTYTI